MGSSLGQDDARRALEESRAAILELLGRLDVEEFVRSATIGGGEWSAKDLLRHLTLWEEFAIEATADWRAARRPVVEQVFADHAVDEVNEREYRRQRDLPAEIVRSHAESVHAQLLRTIGDMPQEEWDAPAFYDNPHRETLGDLLGSVLGAPRRPFRHAEAHLEDLRRFMASLPGPR